MNAEALIAGLTQRAQAATFEADDIIGEDGLRHCRKCGGPKQSYIQLKDGRQVLVPVVCPCQSDKNRKAEAAWKLNQNIIRVESFRRDSLIHSAIYDQISLKNDDRKNAKISEMVNRYVDSWEEIATSGTGILFAGSTGAGKTFYAAGIANRLKDRGILTGVASFPALVMAMSRNSTEILNEIGKYKLLVLDDFGASRGTSYGLETTYNIVERREASHKPTIITTNIPVDTLERLKDPEMRRIYDRVLAMGSIRITLTGPSERQKQADNRRDITRKIMYGERKA